MQNIVVLRNFQKINRKKPVEESLYKISCNIVRKETLAQAALQIRAGQQSITANLHPLITHIYYVMITVTGDFSKKSFYYYYFQEILLNNLELVFLEFKHLQNTQNKFVFFLSVQFLLVVS